MYCGPIYSNKKKMQCKKCMQLAKISMIFKFLGQI